MPSEVILPRVDMDMATGKISKWLVDTGTVVTKGQPLFEIETDKATMEIEAEASGTIRDLAEVGSKDIPVGSVVAWIFADNESEKVAAEAALAPAVEKPSAPSPPAPHALQDAAIVAPLSSDGSGRQRATPLARRLARSQGIDLARLRGSGPRGRIQAEDVATLTQGQASAASRSTASLTDLRQVHADADLRPSARVVESPAPPAPVADGVRSLREGTGIPLMLVHGFGSEAASWRPFLHGLETTRPVHALDLPGHGAVPLGGARTFDSLVEAVGTTLADLGPMDVVAHSLGAAVMTAVAARGKADVRSLLLLAPAGLGPEINGGFVQGYLAATSEASLAPWMHELVADPQVITPTFVRATLKSREGTDRLLSQRELASGLFPDGTQSFSIRADLLRLRIPTRVVFGSADKIIPARHGSVLPPLVALHLLPNVGHMSYLEARETVAAILSYAVPR